MDKSFTPNNIEIWIDNYKRKNIIGQVAKSWLDSFPFERINIIVNHPSVDINDFPEEIKDKVKLWPNALRHPLSRGPINKNYNQAMVHTFLSGKYWCILAHDSYVVNKNWDSCIHNNPGYEFITCPQGDGIMIQSLDGLRKIGWFDEGYATMNWHEIDILARALRKSFILKEVNCSLTDFHGLWPREFPFVQQGTHRLYYNSIGLENYWHRLDKNQFPQIGPKSSDKFINQCEDWHKRKWVKMFDQQPHGSGTLYNILNGCRPEYDNINWYPWLDLDNLQPDIMGY